jgi:GNAT superfamily N-acetyltransferase
MATDISVERLEAPAAADAGLVERLTELVNRVYDTAERGMWREGATRTTGSEMAVLIGARQIAVATRDEDVVGSVWIHDDVSDGVGEFGMLAAAPEQRGIGIGRALLDFVEDTARERGLRAMQLELLVPRGWKHPTKEFLEAWYGRRGYRLVRTGRLDDAYPQLAPLLATPCDLEIHQKPLTNGSER